jgi:hypothetical protein
MVTCAKAGLSPLSRACEISRSHVTSESSRHCRCAQAEGRVAAHTRASVTTTTTMKLNLRTAAHSFFFFHTSTMVVAEWPMSAGSTAAVDR